MAARSQVGFPTSTVNSIQLESDRTRPEIPVPPVIDCQRVAELATDNIGIFLSPTVVADCTPFTLVGYLDKTFTVPSAALKTHREICSN